MTDQEFVTDLVAVREAFKDAKNRDLNLSDKVLNGFIERAGDKWDEMDEEQTIKFLLDCEKEVSKVSIADPGISRLVAKMDGHFHEVLREQVEITVKGKTTAVEVYAQMKRIYTADEMDAFAYPGSNKDEMPAVVGNFSYKMDKVVRKDNTGKDITTVWCNDFADSTPEGKEYNSDIDDVGKEKKASGSVARFKGWSKADLNSLLSEATARRNALRSMFKRAIKLHHHLRAIDNMPKVGVKFSRAKTGKFITIPEDYGTGKDGTRPIKATLAPKCLWMWPADAPEDGRDFSVTQVLAFDIGAAINAGGSMADLVATAGRDTPPPEGVDGEGDGADMEPDAAQAVFSQAINWLNKTDNRANLRRIVADKKNSDRKDWIENIGDLFHLIAPEYERVKAIYTAIKQNKVEEEEEQAEKTAA